MTRPPDPLRWAALVPLVPSFEQTMAIACASKMRDDAYLRLIRCASEEQEETALRELMEAQIALDNVWREIAASQIEQAASEMVEWERWVRTQFMDPVAIVRMR